MTRGQKKGMKGVIFFSCVCMLVLRLCYGEVSSMVDTKQSSTTSVKSAAENFLPA